MEDKCCALNNLCQFVAGRNQINFGTQHGRKKKSIDLIAPKTADITFLGL